MDVLVKCERHIGLSRNHIAMKVSQLIKHLKNEKNDTINYNHEMICFSTSNQSMLFFFLKKFSHEKELEKSIIQSINYKYLHSFVIRRHYED